MDLHKQQFTTEVAGQKLTLEISRLGEQATAAVLGQYGETSVLVTVVMGKQNRDTDYFPLTVDYEEKFYAAGKIIGSRFIRREGRPSEEAILSGRLIDRALRPLFNQRMRRETQIVITVLSYDEDNDPDFISLITASTALAISEIPWQGPVAGVKISRTAEGENLINPTNTKIKDQSTQTGLSARPSTKENLLCSGSKINFSAFVAGIKTSDEETKINMIELSGDEADENNVIEGFDLAQKEISKLIDFQEKIIKEIGRPKAEVLLAEPNPEIKSKIQDFLKDKLEDAIFISEKTERQNNLDNLKQSLKEYLEKEEMTDGLKIVDAVLEEETDKLLHKNILEKEKRPDGRRLDEVRELHAEVGLFKRLHGSALFIRGGTQALAVTTLAAPGAEQLIETMETTAKRRFLLHYNFPPYSTGEIKRLGGPGRREIGHGALVDKAIKIMIPSQEEFPYTIRVVSEILSSNGSSSMASVCASSMSLMDAGVPIRKPVAGIAMGVITDQRLMTNDQRLMTNDQRQSLVVGRKSSVNYKILTDIQGPEDHYGDMDCKVAGTKDGVTAIQMDVKIDGFTLDILKEVFEQAKKARLEILEVMSRAIAQPREKISPFAPLIMTLEINPEQIGEVIGPGGKMIKKITKDTGVDAIDIEESGRIFVASTDPEKAMAAVNYIKSLTRQFQVGETVEGEIIKILDFGAIVDLGAGKDGMIHISELKNGFVEKVEDVVKIGDYVKAKVVRVENGKIGLSLKAISSQ